MSAASSRKAQRASAGSEPDALQAGGFVPLSTTDYPGRLAAVVFCQGCPWGCGYCHNPHLIPTAPACREQAPAWPDILARLSARRGLLDAVVFSGGEPLLQRGLGAAMREVRALGFKVGLHTGGAYPERLETVLPLCDWVGLDIKAPFARYDAVTGAPGSGARARASLELLVQSGVSHECRTTVHRSLHPLHELLGLAEELLLQGVECYVLQPFRAQGCRDANLNAAHDAAATAALLQRAANVFPGVLTRPA
jgi:pyruvate formate lyase activating enzyme